MPVEPPIETPRTLTEAFAVLATGAHRPIAGGTDVMVQITGEIGPPPERMIDLSRLDELRGIAIDRGELRLGALTTYTDIRRSALCREHVPALVEAAATIGAAQIQNRGTIGGNVANASPAGDTLPAPPPPHRPPPTPPPPPPARAPRARRGGGRGRGAPPPFFFGSATAG